MPRRCRLTERTRNSLKNIAFGLTGQILNIVMSFIARTVLVNTLGDLYSGIAGNFTNILMVFSLADLGVGTAIIYALYKPIALKDESKIQALMKLYAKAYRIIGFVIIALGLAMTPFIQYFMKSDEVIPNLRLIFMMYVINTASSYFLAYKGTLITANQKNYIVTNVVYATSVVSYGIQIVILLTTKNYLLSLGVQVVTNISQNVITMLIANKMYPYIKGRNNSQLKVREKRRIFRNVFSMMNYRIGQVVLNGTDSIVISSMIGVVETGIYSNYNLLLTTVKNLLQQVFHAITASVGNLNALETEEKKYDAFRMIFFGNFWMFGFAAVCFYSLIDPFVLSWLGKTRVVEPWVSTLLVLNFYLLGMRNTIITFRDTMGIFRQGRFVPLMGAALNIAISVALAPSMGMLGVFIGTTASIMLTMFWLEPLVLYKHGFKRSPLEYFLKYILYLIVTAAVAFGVKYVSDLLVPGGGIGWFAVRMVIAAVTPNVVFFILFFRTREFRMLKSAVLSVLSRKLRRRRAH